jgi:hypothetical protein
MQGDRRTRRALKAKKVPLGGLEPRLSAPPRGGIFGGSSGSSPPTLFRRSPKIQYVNLKGALKLPIDTYLELDLDVHNLHARESSFDSKGWQITVAPNDTLPAERETLTLEGGASSRISVRFGLADTDERALSGGMLALDDPPLGKYEPELVPLNASWQRDFPQRIDALFETSIRGVDTDERSEAIFEFDITGAWYDVNDVREEQRAELDMRFVRVDFVASLVQNIVGDSTVGESGLRLIANGREYEPDNHVNEAVALGESVDLSMLYQIPSQVTRFELSFQTNSRNSNLEPMRIPVDLAGTRLAAAGEGAGRAQGR